MPVDWAVLEQSSTIEKKMQPWIAKKVTEYFGETDETVISFVMEEVRARNLQEPLPGTRQDTRQRTTATLQSFFSRIFGRIMIAVNLRQLGKLLFVHAL